MRFEPATLLKVTLLDGCFTFFKLYKWYQIAQRITHNFIPNKMITCTDKEPSRFNNEIRQILNQNDLLKLLIRNGRTLTQF